MKKNALIAFEGIDGAGKATQVALLKKRLRAEGRTVTTFRFPRYETALGKLIKNTLHGVYGDFHKSSQYHALLPYSIDRGLASDKIRTGIKKGVVISDRYTSANLAFGGALCSAEELPKFIRFFENLEYGELNLPRPDIVIYLAPTIQASQARLKAESKKLDRNESDARFQEDVARVYEKLAKRKNWITIRCEADESPKEIHERIWKKIEGRVA